MGLKISTTSILTVSKLPGFITSEAHKHSLSLIPWSPFTLSLVFELKGLSELLYGMFGRLQTGTSSLQGYAAIKGPGALNYYGTYKRMIAWKHFSTILKVEWSRDASDLH